MKKRLFSSVAALFACVSFAFAGDIDSQVEFGPVKIVYEGGVLDVPASGGAKARSFKASPKSARLSERRARKGKSFAKAEGGSLSAAIVAIPGSSASYFPSGKKEGKGGAEYVRYVMKVRNEGTEPVKINRFVIMDGWAPEGATDGEKVGNTDGSVAIFPSKRIFVGVENPLTKLTVDGGRVKAVLPREDFIRPGETWSVAWSAGTYAKGQLRRDFQRYLNRERAHPYRVLPHYNSWYDINIGRNDAPWEKRMNEAEALGVMVKFREELTKRGVFIDSYLWDDGWDDWNSLWDFHPGFPDGFKKLADEAHKNKGASIGAWMSPCGGYGGSQAARVRYAKEKGIIGQNDGLLRMSSPTYYKAFRDRVLAMIKDYDMNIFKFDRMGVGHDCDGAPDSHAADMEAIVSLIGEMREAKQDVFVNATVGTWASPYWVMFADSIWRGRDDFDRAGDGRNRQRWITYRDNQIHDRFVAKSPLFPLNSMMSHGIIVTKHGPPGCEDVSDSAESTQDFADEVWMSVACGTDLQEYYITPSLMHEKWWDILADGVKWLKANVDTLVDVHWVGGDPLGDKANVYGYASWKPGKGKKPGKGIVILRNPSKDAQTFKSSLAELLELPESEKGKNVRGGGGLKHVYEHDVKIVAPKGWTAEKPVAFEFGPFGVILVEVDFN
ncbi:MAG: enterotoxin [Kiritimatiellae bacterium]|nr:enterotoxin [Kiritimatiellia bacterium]